MSTQRSFDPKSGRFAPTAISESPPSSESVKQMDNCKTNSDRIQSRPMSPPTPTCPGVILIVIVAAVAVLTCAAGQQRHTRITKRWFRRSCFLLLAAFAWASSSCFFLAVAFATASIAFLLISSFLLACPSQYQEHLEAVLTSSSMVCAKGRNDKPQT